MRKLSSRAKSRDPWTPRFAKATIRDSSTPLAMVKQKEKRGRMPRSPERMNGRWSAISPWGRHGGRACNLIGDIGLPLIVADQLRSRFAHFNPGVHFVDLRVLRGQSVVDGGQRGFEFLHLLMLFEELVQQHHAHRIVAYG